MSCAFCEKGFNENEVRLFTKENFNKAKKLDVKFGGFPLRDLLDTWEFSYFKDFNHFVRCLIIRASQKRHQAVEKIFEDGETGQRSSSYKDNESDHIDRHLGLK